MPVDRRAKITEDVRILMEMIHGRVVLVPIWLNLFCPEQF